MAHGTASHKKRSVAHVITYSEKANVSHTTITIRSTNILAEVTGRSFEILIFDPNFQKTMETPPPDLSQSDRSVIFNGLDLTLNTTILQALLHAGMVMKIMQILSTVCNSANDISKHSQFTADVDWPLIYIFLMLATNLHAPGMSATYKIVEMLIESAAINLDSAYYADVIATYVKAIAPTLLVGCVSAHANAVSQHEKMVAMWSNHPPLVGCF
ncbi:hypothetical protein EDD85DRAFT_785183 [Armillaria nabsnona]|nr:hypothetical protein EDD85DRAFT_785183 [Armillaria nabsnona]